MGKRGPRPKPTALRVLDSNPSGRPINHDEPRPTGAANCPEHLRSDAKAVWVANSSTIPQLLELFASDGTTSTHISVLREDGQGGFIMLTRPVVFTEKQPTLGDKGDIVLADFSQYVIGLRMEANIQRSMHLGFTKDTSHFRLILRVDGKGKWDEPVTPRNGPTQSWCVTLDARA